jgi:hypothetical protein
VTEMRQVQLPEELCAAVQEKFGGQFASFEELLVFILRDLSLDDASLQEAEERIVEERLRELGYI